MSTALRHYKKAAEYNICGTPAEDTNSVTDASQIIVKHSTPSATNGVFRYKKASDLWTYIASKIRSTFGFSNSAVLSAANGGTGATNLQQVTVGSASNITVYTSTGSGATPAATYTTRKVIMSTAKPTAADGNNGDIWIKY